METVLWKFSLKLYILKSNSVWWIYIFIFTEGGNPLNGGYKKLTKGGLIFRGLGGFEGANRLNPLISSIFGLKGGWIFRGLRGLNKILEYGIIFVSEIWTFSEMVPFLLRNFSLFWNSTILSPLFLHSQSQKGV